MNNKFLYEGECVSSCPTGYYEAQSSYVLACIKCDTGFSTCNSNGTNTVCQSGFTLNLDGVCECSDSLYLYEGACYSTCPTGTYVQGANC